MSEKATSPRWRIVSIRRNQIGQGSATLGEADCPFCAAREEERRRVLRRFRLHEAHEQGRFPIIDQITHLAKAIFAVDSVLVNVGTCTLWSYPIRETLRSLYLLLLRPTKQ